MSSFWICVVKDTGQINWKYETRAGNWESPEEKMQLRTYGYQGEGGTGRIDWEFWID